MLSKLNTGFLALILLVSTGCGGDDGGVGPADPGTPNLPTHHEVSVKMSSITAVEDCDSGSPGEFRYRMIVRKWDELGNKVIVGSFGPDEMALSAGDTGGSPMDEIRFVLPRESGAKFEIEYWLGEYDGATADFENHSWVTHVYDRSEEEEWEGNSRWETYNTTDEDTYGITKFTVWSTRGDCKGYAKYIVRWKPYSPAS